MFKKILVILFLVALGFAELKPVIKRDAICKGKWYIYTPMDPNGDMWSRWDLAFVNNDVANSPIMSTHKVIAGRIRPAQQILAGGTGWEDSDSAIGVSENTIWTGIALPDTKWGRVTIPDSHDLIRVIYWSQSNYADLGLYWEENGEDTLIASIDTDPSSEDSHYGCNEYTITGASANGRKLVMKNNSGGTYIKILGICSWDTDGTGVITEGGDIVDRVQFFAGHEHNSCDVRQADTVNESSAFDVSATSTSSSNLTVSATGWAIRWGPEGGTMKFSGDNSHYGSGQAEYQLTGDYVAYGFKLRTDNDNREHVFDDVNNPRGSIYEANSITLTEDGYCDFDEDDVQDADEPLVRFSIVATNDGLTYNIAILFTASTDVTTSVYSPMWDFNNAETITLKSFGRDDITLADDDIAANPGFNTVILSSDGLPSDVEIEISRPIQGPRFKWWAERQKFYGVSDVATCPGSYNGDTGINTVAADSVWSLGGTVKIRAYGGGEAYPICENPPTMDTNGDCKITIEDFTVFVSEWLTCGYRDKTNCWE